MTSFPNTLAAEPAKRRVAPLTVVLAIVVALFCSFLVFVFVATKIANPVMLDAQGHPIGQSNSSAQPVH